MSPSETPSGPDLAQGVDTDAVPAGGVLPARVGDEPVLLFRGDLWSAVSGRCTHYGAPLAEGLIRDGTVTCPWHHACFSLRSGVALKAPAFDPLDRWEVEIAGGRLFVRRRMEVSRRAVVGALASAGPIVIVGGGGAGFAAAEMLRRLGYDGALEILSEDGDPPCDRPNLSKDYLAGTAPDEWIPLKDANYYREQKIDLRLATRVERIDIEGRAALTAAGERLRFDRLLIATGSEPIRLRAPGFDAPQVHALRSLADARAIIASTRGARTATVVGASFIGLETAAALRSRGLEVDVVAPETVPLARILGPELGAYVRTLHESHGVRFHLGRTAASYDGRFLWTDDGKAIAADLVVVGIGVRPRTALAEAAGIAVGNGVLVDEWLETNVPGIYAAGDIAAYPSPAAGGRARVEHWVVAERQGQIAAVNMLGGRRRYVDPPFFWSRHYDQSILYVGEAGPNDERRIDGTPEKGDGVVRFFAGNRLTASAAIGRAAANLEDEARLLGQVEASPAVAMPAMRGNPPARAGIQGRQQAG